MRVMKNQGDLMKQLQQPAAVASDAGNDSSSRSPPVILELDPDLMLQHPSQLKPVAGKLMLGEMQAWEPLLTEWNKGWSQHLRSEEQVRLRGSVVVDWWLVVVVNLVNWH